MGTFGNLKERLGTFGNQIYYITNKVGGATVVDLMSASAACFKNLETGGPLGNVRNCQELGEL
jgi:hypothetical protein